LGILRPKKPKSPDGKPLISSTKDTVPEAAWSLFESGLNAEKNGNKEEAKEKYEQAVELYPEFEAAWINLAMVHQDLGNPMMPIVTMKQALEHLPSSSLLWASLGSFYSRIELMDSAAEEAYRKALELNPNDIVAAVNLGTHLARQGKLDDAEKILTLSREMPSVHEQFKESKEMAGRVWAQLALIRARLGMRDHAKTAIRKAIEMDNASPFVLELTAKANALLGDLRAAEEQMPENADTWYGIGHSLDMQKNYPKAIEAYQKAISLDPKHVLARVNLGAVLVDTGEYRKAQEILQTIVDEEPSNHIAWMNLGKALIAQENEKEGEHALQQVIKHKPDYVNAWYQLACLYDRQRRMQDAESAFRKTVEYSPEHYRAWSDLGVLLIEMGKHNEAEAPLRNATKFGADDVKSWVNLGAYLSMMKRCDEAKKILEHAQKLDPKDAHVRQLSLLWNQECGDH